MGSKSEVKDSKTEWIMRAQIFLNNFSFFMLKADDCLKRKLVFCSLLNTNIGSWHSHNMPSSNGFKKWLSFNSILESDKGEQRSIEGIINRRTQIHHLDCCFQAGSSYWCGGWVCRWQWRGIEHNLIFSLICKVFLLYSNSDYFTKYWYQFLHFAFLF